MSPLRLVFLELVYRPLSASLTVGISCFSLSCIVLSVGFSTFLDRQTREIQRDMGLNIRILPRQADLGDYWTNGFAEGTLPEQLLVSLEQQDVANRLVPMLQRSIPWGSGTAILTGVGQETFSRGQTKKRVFSGPSAADDRVILGAVAAQRRGLSEGDSVAIEGRKFTVATVLTAEGSLDDNRVHLSLASVQELLGLEGRINEIRALECNCEESVTEPEEYLRQQLGPILADAQIIRHDRIADARRKQRQLAHRFAAVVAPTTLVLAAFCIFGLAYQNANERSNEFGLFSTMGFPASRLVAISCLRSGALSCVGGVVGAVVGCTMLQAMCANEGWLDLTWELSGGLPDGFLLKWMGWGAALGGILGAVAAVLPAMLVAHRDPATILAGQ